MPLTMFVSVLFLIIGVRCLIAGLLPESSKLRPVFTAPMHYSRRHNLMLGFVLLGIALWMFLNREQ